MAKEAPKGNVVDTKSDEKSSAAAYEVTITGSGESGENVTVFEQTKNDGVQRLEIHEHVDMVTMLILEVGGAENQPN